jgi:hypothetical protein
VKPCYFLRCARKGRGPRVLLRAPRDDELSTPTQENHHEDHRFHPARPVGSRRHRGSASAYDRRASTDSSIVRPTDAPSLSVAASPPRSPAGRHDEHARCRPGRTESSSRSVTLASRQLATFVAVGAARATDAHDTLIAGAHMRRGSICTQQTRRSGHSARAFTFGACLTAREGETHAQAPTRSRRFRSLFCSLSLPGRVSLSRRHPHRKRRPRCNAADNTNASRSADDPG